MESEPEMTTQGKVKVTETIGNDGLWRDALYGRRGGGGTKRAEGEGRKGSGRAETGWRVNPWEEQPSLLTESRQKGRKDNGGKDG